MQHSKQSIEPGATCIVVGAGISGLLAANRLQAAGVRVTVLDKGRNLGGRMATRRLDHAIFDHGAQFITTRDPVFTELMQSWIADGLIAEWATAFARPLDADSSHLASDLASHVPSDVASDRHPRYFVRNGMTALPRHLADGLQVHSNTRVAEIVLDTNAGAAHSHSHKWHVRLTTGDLLSADGLILTPPVPQSLDLLDLGGVEIPESCRTRMSAVRYHPCLTWMALPTSDRRLPRPGGMQFKEGSLQFLADNQQKGISPEASSITIHASPDFSQRFFDADEIENWGRIVNEVAEHTGPLRRASFQRWRYSQPVATDPQRCLRVNLPAPLILCGDAFGGPRIEGAALSGLAAAHSILSPIP